MTLMGQKAETRTLIILAFSATAGVLVEFYDFFIYGYAAASAFPSTFFPNLPATQALVFSYIAFGAGFPARLLGAFIFGHFGDRSGRKYPETRDLNLHDLDNVPEPLLQTEVAEALRTSS